jgi:Family of unknown function (DUF5677)
MTVPMTPFDPGSVRFGNPDQWRAFGERNQRFLSAFDKLRSTLEQVFLRTLPAPSKIDRFVFAMGRLAVDDFMEILAMCGNAEAWGAQKLLRTMFERVVTLLWLQRDPTRLDDYLDFFWISEWKLLNAIETTFEPGLVSPERVREVRERYEQVKARFQTMRCENCGHARLSVSWSPKDLITMAREVDLKMFIVPAYYLPLAQGHPTMQGLLSRLEWTEEDGLTFGPRLDPSLADRVLLAAHGLLLHAFDAQLRQFGLDASMYEGLERDFSDAWRT